MRVCVLDEMRECSDDSTSLCLAMLCQTLLDVTHLRMYIYT